MQHFARTQHGCDCLLYVALHYCSLVIVRTSDADASSNGRPPRRERAEDTTTDREGRVKPHYLLGVVVVAMVAIFAVAGGCGENQPSIAAVDKLEMDAIAVGGATSIATRPPGALHTAGMIFIFTRLSARRAHDGRLTRGTLIQTIIQACIEFLANERLPTRECALLARLVEMGASASSGATWPSRFALQQVVGDDDMDPLVYDFMNQIEAEYYASSSAADYASRIAGVEVAAIAALAGDDLDAVLDAASIAVASAEYWEAEFPAWAVLVLTECEGLPPEQCPVIPQDNRDLVTAGVDWMDLLTRARNVVVADVSAGIGGSLANRLLKLAVPEAAAAAAVVASSAQAGLELAALLN
jgi:hypothetical protein